MTVITASRVALPALSSTVALRKSGKRTRGSGEERPEEVAHAVRAVHHDVRLLLEPRRALVRAHPHAQRVAEAAGLDQLAEGAEGVEVRRVIADVERGGEVEVAQ